MMNFWKNILNNITNTLCAGRIGIKVDQFISFHFKLVLNFFQKSWDFVKQFTGKYFSIFNKLTVKLQAQLTQENLIFVLKKIPRQLERISRIFLLQKVHILDRAAQKLLKLHDHPDLLAEGLKMLPQVMLLYFFLTYDVISPEFLDAVFNATPLESRLMIPDPTSYQLELIDWGSLVPGAENLTDVLDHDRKLVAERAAVRSSKWYIVRWELVAVAAVIVIFGINIT